MLVLGLACASASLGCLVFSLWPRDVPAFADPPSRTRH